MWQWAGMEWGLPLMGVAAVTWAATVGLGTSTPPSSALRRPPPSLASPYPAESLGRLAVARDLFRAGRRPAATLYNPIRGVQPVGNAPPKPVLAVVGIVSGKEPTAVIEGFPGIEGARVVRVGDVIAGLRVKRISAAAVRLTGLDTVWTLTVREPWQ